MLAFTRMNHDSPLFTAPTGPGGWSGFALGRGAVCEEDAILIDRSLTDASLKGVFLFAARPPDCSTAEKASLLVESVLSALASRSAQRAVVWLPNPDNAAEGMHVLQLSDMGDYVEAGYAFPLCQNLSVTIAAGVPVSLAEEGQALSIGQQFDRTIVFSGAGAPGTGVTAGDIVRISFTGPLCGVLSYEFTLSVACINDFLNGGFQLLIPNTDPDSASARPHVAQWYPLFRANLPSSYEPIPFCARINPAKAANLGAKTRVCLGAESVFLFKDSAQSLPSWFRTDSGRELVLSPFGLDAGESPNHTAGFVPHGGTAGASGKVERGTFVFSPRGDFALSCNSCNGAGETGIVRLLCGNNATETIAFNPRTKKQAGDRLRFTAGKSAFIPVFPLPEASPVAAPSDSVYDLPAPDFLTSHCTVVRTPEQPGAPHYQAQPEGARLFGKNAAFNGSPGLLWPADPGQALPQPPVELSFPLFPLAGVSPGDGVIGMSPETIAQLEAAVVAPIRKHAIARAETMRPSFSARNSFGMDGGANGTMNIVAPSGVLVSIDAASGVWKSIRLGQITTLGQEYEFAFSNPCGELQQAFNTSRLCLVIANGAYLGKQGAGGSGTQSAGSVFANRVCMEGWGLSAAVGMSNRYGDYDNVMIVKNCPGKLADLVRNPSAWTMPAEFAAPSVKGSKGRPDAGQLVVLSQWLQDYLEDGAAKAKTNPEFYRLFANMAEDEHWSGILVLKARITDLPHDLAGLAAGLDPNAFRAHHFAMNLTAIDAESVTQKDSSSIFGLIDYTDAGLDSDGEEHPVPPASGTYDFKVLRLQALFENSTVQRFHSLAQLSLNRLFDDNVTGMGAGGNGYNAILLRGSYQNNGGAPVYRLSGSGADNFLLPGKILRGVRVTDAQMSTMEAGGNGRNTVSRISLAGQMFFGIPGYVRETEDDETELPIDLFSFGPAGGGMEGGNGLAFDRLDLIIRQPLDGSAREIALDTDSIVFRPATEVTRCRSLARQFALTLEGLTRGDKDSSPQDKGYLPVVTDCRFQPVDGGIWNALRFRVNMGTPGALAGKLNLTSTLLLAWGAGGAGDGAPAVYVGLKLPGAGGGSELFSLQNVVKLSVGMVRLVRDAKKDAFVLLLSDIALKLFGLKNIPPGGSTAFYLFGDPAGTENASGLGWYAVYNRGS